MTAIGSTAIHPRAAALKSHIHRLQTLQVSAVALAQVVMILTAARVLLEVVQTVVVLRVEMMSPCTLTPIKDMLAVLPVPLMSLMLVVVVGEQVVQVKPDIKMPEAEHLELLLSLALL